MMTDMQSGDTTVVGAGCLAGFALGFAATVSAGMTPEAATAYGEQFDQIRANDSRPASPDAPTVRSGPQRAKRAKSAADPEPEPDSPGREPIDSVNEPL